MPRAQQRADRSLLWTAMAGAAWLVLYTVLVATSRSSDELMRFVDNAVYLVPIALATVLSYGAAVRGRGRTGLAWRLLVVSNALWLSGEVIWLVYAYARPEGPPAPSAADVGYLSSYLVALVAILIGSGGGLSLRSARGVLDAILVVGAVAAVGWTLVIGPLVPDSTDLSAVTIFAYPLIAVGIVSVLVAVGLAGHRRIPLSIILAGVAFAVSGLADACYSYISVVKAYAYSDTGWLNLGWQVEAVLLCVAATVAIRRREGDAQTRQLDRDLAVLPALVAALTIGALAGADWLQDHQVSTFTILVTGALFAGLLVRQLMATRERTLLAGRLEGALREQERLAITDGLTGLYNRRFFQEVLGLAAERAARQGSPLSLILLDLDEFKSVNDTYGHSVGDTVLAQVADRIRQSVRGSDVTARYGGEEFVCLLPGAAEESALELAERVRAGVSREPVPTRGGFDIALTASLGVSTATASGRRGYIDVDELINGADEALYRAKARGRNRVAVAGQLTEPELDPDPDLPAALVWIADQVDAKIGEYEHTTAVARWSLATAQRLGLDDAALRRTAAAGRLHDIGKINIDGAILTKRGRLTGSEWRDLRRYPEESARLLTELGQRVDVAAIVAAHRERYDGLGYPRGLAGADIPIEARIVAVCDTWAAMRNERPYARALGEGEARTQLERGRGTQFDPDIVAVFLHLLDEGVIDELAPLRASLRSSAG